MVDDLEHVMVVADLRMAFSLRIVGVGLFVRNLLEHGSEEDVDTGVLLDQIAEFDEDGVQVLGILVDVVNNAAEPFLVSTLVVRKPFAQSVEM